jgi:hypothetical protein
MGTQQGKKGFQGMVGMANGEKGVSRWLSVVDHEFP